LSYNFKNGSRFRLQALEAHLLFRQTVFFLEQFQKVGFIRVKVLGGRKKLLTILKNAPV